MASKIAPDILAAQKKQQDAVLKFLSGAMTLAPSLIQVWKDALVHEEWSIRLAAANQVKDLFKAQIARLVELTGDLRTTPDKAMLRVILEEEYGLNGK